MKKNNFIITLVFCALIAVSCKNETTVTTADENQKTEVTDPLPSWNEGDTKNAIMGYVGNVTTKGSANFIPIADRIATFDNDGNLWSEQPAYFQLFFAMDRIKALAPEHPEWKTTQPYQSVLEDDMSTLMSYGEHGLIKIVMATHADNTIEEFEHIVKDWLATAKHNLRLHYFLLRAN